MWKQPPPPEYMNALTGEVTSDEDIVAIWTAEGAPIREVGTEKAADQTTITIVEVDPLTWTPLAGTALSTSG